MPRTVPNASDDSDASNADNANNANVANDAIHDADTPETSDFVNRLQQHFRSHADPEAAAAMEAYMKGQYPFLGLRQPVRMSLTRDFLSANGAPSGNQLIRASTELWELPEREFQYTAIVLLEKNRKRAGPEFLPLYEKLIVSKSWWDTVDLLASKLVGQLFLNDTELARRTIPAWISSDHMWLRRTALLFQLTYKERTNAEWLFALIRECAHEKEFFIRKAIGWALREYAKTDPAAVRTFVNETNLSGLSVKEALKHIGKGDLRSFFRYSPFISFALIHFRITSTKLL